MKNKSLIIIVTQSILIIGLLWLIIYFGKDEILKKDIDSELKMINESEVENLVSIKNKRITISDSMIKNSGIEIQLISESKERSLYSSYGYVVNLKSLFNYKTNYLNLVSEINKLNIQFKEEREHFKKLKLLNEDNKNISDSAIHKKEIEINNHHHNLKIQINNKNNLLQVIEQEWGKLFKELLISPEKSLLKDIFNSETKLLKIIIPNNKVQKSPPLSLMVSSFNQPKNKFEASFISNAPFSDGDIQGRSYFYLTSSINLIMGSKINSYVQIAEDINVKKYFIPKSAIVWSDGKPWVYEALNNNLFFRHSLFQMEEVDNGWIVEFDKMPPIKIVSKGTQLLLSEEYKHLITNENED